jgi:uracil-DNA glycosylase
MAHLPRVELMLLVGSYAQRHYLGDRRAATMTETVQAWREHVPRFIPLPHPSWRNTAWLKRNPWFETDVLPELRNSVDTLLRSPDERNRR